MLLLLLPEEDFEDEPELLLLPDLLPEELTLLPDRWPLLFETDCPEDELRELVPTEVLLSELLDAGSLYEPLCLDVPSGFE